jgi:hypothetical protein
MATKKLIFGIYPGGGAGTDMGITSGPPDDDRKIVACLDQLQGEVRPFVVRVYERFSDVANPSKWPHRTPSDFLAYAGNGRVFDLVVMFQSSSGDVEGFLKFLGRCIRENAQHLYSVQVTEEASFVNGPDCIDGPYPNVRRALVSGVIAAREELDALNLSDVKVGFNSTPTFGPESEFWAALKELGGSAFRDALGYVGVDFFPDVFRRVPADRLASATIGVLEAFRSQWMPAAGLGPQIPIHIAEHGWPTGPDRTEQRQAEVLEEVIGIIQAEAARLNIERYTLFDLRDADSRNTDFFHRFGITRDDYSPKPAFEVYRRLIQSLRRDS